MLIETFLRRLVVVRDHEHEAIHTQLLHITREIDRVSRAVVTHVGDNGHFPIDLRDDRLEELHLLGIEHRRAFASGAIDDERIGPVLNKTTSQRTRLFEVEIEVLVERSDHCGNHTTKTRRCCC